MSDQKKKPLRLHRETLRALSRSELAQVGGAQDGPVSGGGNGIIIVGGTLPTWITSVANTWSALCPGDRDGGGGC